MAENIELDISIAALKKDLEDLQKELQNTGKVSESAFGTIGDEVTALTQEMQDLLQVQRETGTDIKKLEGASAGFSTRLKSTIRDTQVFGKTIGEWGDQISGVISKMSAGGAGVGRFAGAFKVLSTVIKATGLGLLIGVVGSLITYFTKFQAGIDKVSRVTAALGAVVDVMVNRFLSLGSAIGNFFSGNFSAAADDLAASFTGVATEIFNAATAAYDLEAAFQQLRDDSRTLGVELARQAVQLGKLKALADDETQSIGRRSVAQQKANALEQQSLEKKLSLAERQRDLDLKSLSLLPVSAELRDNAAKSEIEYLNLVAEANDAQIQGEQALRELRNKAAEERKKIRDKEAADEEKRAALRVAVVSGETEKQIAAEQLRYTRLLADLRKYFEGRDELNGLIEQAEKQHKANVAGIYLNEAEEAQKRLDELQKLRAAQAEYEKEINKERIDEGKKNLQAIKDLEESEIALNEENFKNFIAVLEANGASKKQIADAQREFDKLTKTATLESEIKFQEGLLALVDAGDKKQIETIKNKIATIKAQIAGLSIASKSSGTEKNWLLDLLGFKKEDQKAIKQAIDEVTAGLQNLTAARVESAKAAVEAADQEVQASEDKVQRAKDDLDTELRLADLGFASDVTRKRNALALAEKEEADAKVRRERALVEQRKAQRAQILLDSALQASNLITSSTSIYKSLAPLGPFGIGLAIGTIALMVGSFLKSKALALQATKARQGIHGKVGKQGIVVGPSHENDGVPLEVEGGEFVYQDGQRISVVKKSATSAHFGLLQAINDDDRPAMVKYLERLTGGPRRNQIATSAVSDGVNAQSARAAGTSSAIESLLVKNNALAEENNRLSKRLIEIEEERAEIVDMGDHVVIKRKGRTERVNKRRQ